MPNIAICFFGITRSLRYTIDNIVAHVITPARAAGSVRLYGHFFAQSHVYNPRNGENGRFPADEHALLNLDALELEEPEHCLGLRDHAGLAAWGDAWDNGGHSLRNLVHQLHSLDRVTNMALAGGADMFLFARPDLRYHDSLAGPIRRAVTSASPLVQLPYWQPWYGFNDRFALCSGEAAARAYGGRIAQAHAMCARNEVPLHGERLVKFALAEADIPVRFISSRASRVRVDGHERYEDFARPAISMVKRQVMPHLADFAERAGVKSALKRLAGRS